MGESLRGSGEERYESIIAQRVLKCSAFSCKSQQGFKGVLSVYHGLMRVQVVVEESMLEIDRDVLLLLLWCKQRPNRGLGLAPVFPPPI